MDKAVVNPLRSVPEMERNRNSNSVLDVEVSCFRNYTTPTAPVKVNLFTWLSSSKYKKEVEQIRATEDKKARDSLKSRLPAITPSGLFSNRNEKGLIQHSGLIQFDIDLKENRHIENFYELKQQIGNIPNVAYCGLSVSGQGFWGLIPIANTRKHSEHFDILNKQFLKYGIVLDTKPGNVSSLRGYSYDDKPYFNHQAETFIALDMPVESHIRPAKFEHDSSKQNILSEADRVKRCIVQIVDTGVDLTDSYAAWFEIGCSLASAFGEGGREYFHTVSQFHPGYSTLDTDRQYSACLKGNYSYTIATFFGYCKLLLK